MGSNWELTVSFRFSRNRHLNCFGFWFRLSCDLRDLISIRIIQGHSDKPKWNNCSQYFREFFFILLPKIVADFLCASSFILFRWVGFVARWLIVGSSHAATTYYRVLGWIRVQLIGRLMREAENHIGTAWLPGRREQVRGGITILSCKFFRAGNGIFI